MSRNKILHRVMLTILALGFAASALLALLFAVQPARAADEDTVTVSGLSVEWDGNGGAQDFILLQLNGAVFTAGTTSNSHWDYFSSHVFVNGTDVSGKVAWATEGMYTNTSQFCFYVAQNVLRQDGSDVIEIREGCKIPLNDGEDYYVVSETATFVAPVNATGTGTETFVSGSSVTVDGISVEWDGNSGNNDLVTLSLEGAAFDSNVTSNTHRHEIEAYIFVNGTQISDVAWAVEGRYTNPKHYCFYLPQGVLKQDGTDVIEVRRGCHIPVNDGESYYVVSEAVRFAAVGTSSGTEVFQKQLIWEAKEYDASADVFVAQTAQQGVLGGYDTSGVAFGNMSQEHPEWGLPLVEYSAQTIGALSEGQFAIYEFTAPMDAATFKSAEIKFMYNQAGDLFYVYPLGVETLGYENAVQSFRTSASGIQSVTLSAELLSEKMGGGTLNGFIVQLVSGTGGQQFFLDSITPSESGYTPAAVEKVEEPQEFQWETNKQYDIADDLLVYEGNGLTFNPNGNTGWGLRGDGVANTDSLSVNDSFTVEFSTPIPADTANSIQTEFMYNTLPALFYVYPLGTEEMTAATAVQSFRPSSAAVTTAALSLTKLAKDGYIGGFVVQLADGESAQFFLESVTLSEQVVEAEVEVPAEPEKAGDVTVASVQVVWHSEGSNWIYIHLKGAAFTQASEAVAESQFSYFTSHISVNGTLLSDMAGGVFAAKKGYYADQTRFMIELLAGKSYSLRNDGTDVIEIAEGCRFPVTGADSVDYYEVSEAASFRSVSDVPHAIDDNPETFVQQLEWAARKYDADGTVFLDVAAEENVLGGYDSQRVLPKDFSDHADWGLTDYAAYTVNALQSEQFAVFRFTTPIDVSAFKSLSVGYKYGANALFYVYPLGTTALTYENAVQSFRTDGSPLALSLEALAEDGAVKGFIIQLAAGGSAQFFLDDVTPSAAAVTPVKEQASAEKAGDVTVSSVAVRWGAESNRVTFTLSGANFTAVNEASTENFDYFLSSISVNGVKLSDMRSEVLSATKRFYDNATSYMITLSATGAHALKNDGNDVIAVEAGCRFPVSGWELAGGTDYYEVKESAEFCSVSGGNVAQGETPETFVQQLEWAARKYDADGTVFLDVAAQTGALGGYDSQRVLPNDFNDNEDLSSVLTDYAAYTVQAVQSEQFAVFRFTTPIDVSAFKSVVIEYMYNAADALFYVYPLDTQALGFDNAVQSFRTVGSGINTVTLSAEALAGEDGAFGGFILWLADGASAQFFLDSITPSAESHTPGEVEEVIPFAWELGQLFDANEDVFVPTEKTEIGGYSSLPVVVSNVDQWGITAFAAHSGQIMQQGQFLRFAFAEPVDTATAKSMVLDVLHNAAAGFYVYPLDAQALGMEHAVQSFRTEGGSANVEHVTLSLPELADDDGLVRGFIVQLMTDTGAQFFLDGVTLSAETAEAEVEDFTPPTYEQKEVAITEVSYTYRYEGGYDDLLMITFNSRIFTVANERVVLDDFEDFLFINGVSVAESGIGDYALRGMFQRYDRLGIFIKNNQTGSVNNDAFDTITFAEGFAIRGSSEDYTKYTLAADAVYYTNRILDEGQQIGLSKESDPRADQTLTPVAVRFSLRNGQAELSVSFDKTVRSDEAAQAEEVQQYILVDGKKLSEIGGVTVSYADSSTFLFSFAYTPAGESVQVGVAAGLTVQTNPNEPLTQKTVQSAMTFVCGADGAYYPQDDAALNVWWVTSPVITAAEEESGDIGRMTFELRLSVQNATADSLTGDMLQHILIGEKTLAEILAEDSGSSAKLGTFAIEVTVPASYLTDGLTVTAKQGLRTPAGGTLAADEAFTYDGMLEVFVGEVHREEAEPLLTPTDVNTVIRATDGVEKGSNQLFIEFTTPCSFKYLPFAQESAETIFASYGSVGVNIPARYVYELNRYGMRESLWDDLYIDGKSVREWAEADGGKDAARLIDLYYQGTNFGVYYLQIVIDKYSSSAMDWSEPHTLTFKAGFVTPAFGVFEKDVQWAWDPASQTWAPDDSANATVDPDAQLKPEDGEDLFVTGGGTWLIVGLCVGAAVIVAAAVAAVVLLRKKKRKEAASDESEDEQG